MFGREEEPVQRPWGVVEQRPVSPEQSGGEKDQQAGYTGPGEPSAKIGTLFPGPLSTTEVFEGKQWMVWFSFFFLTPLGHFQALVS